MRKSDFFIGLIGILLTALVLISCGSNHFSMVSIAGSSSSEYGVKIYEDSITFSDFRGKEISIPKKPERVVCLYDSYLDLWYKCGGRVVGRVEFSEDRPIEEAKDAEVVGSYNCPDVEKIFSLQPDLVIVSEGMKSHLEIAEILEQSGIIVIAVNSTVKEDYFKTVRIFTALTDREDIYEKYQNGVKKAIDSLILKLPEEVMPNVLAYYNLNPFFAELFKRLRF